MKQRGGGLLFLVAAVLTGLLAAVLAVRAIAGREVRIQVYVAKQEIAAFAPLQPEQFELTQVPATLVPADAVKDLKEAEGRYARGLLLTGTVLRQGHLATARTPGAVTARLTEANLPGARALAINVDLAAGVGGTIQAGDKVDVIAAVKVDNGADAGGATPLAKVVARAVPVLHSMPPNDSGRKGYVVLQVSPELAEEIIFTQMAGTVHLQLNPYNADARAAETKGMTPQRFVDKYGLAMAAPPEKP